MIRASFIRQWKLLCVSCGTVLIIVYCYHKSLIVPHIDWTKIRQRLESDGSSKSPRINSMFIADVTDDIANIKPMYPWHAYNVYFHSAHTDDRGPESVVRIFGIYKNDTNLDGFQCEWQLTGGAANIAFRTRIKWSHIDDGWPKYNMYLAFMMTCPLVCAADNVCPRHVIVARYSSNVSVSVPIIGPVHLSSSARMPLSVCVKPMTGQFKLAKLIEWIEIQRAAGVDQFVVYNTDVFGASRYVLEYYQQKGIVTVISFPFLSSILQIVERHKEISDTLRYALYQQVYLIALQDCVYRFRNTFDYLMFIDVDEVILPTRDEPITALIKRAEIVTNMSASYMFYTSWHFREFTPSNTESSGELYMQMYARCPRPGLHQPKSIVSTDRTITVNHHGVLDSKENVTSSRYLLSWWDFGYVHHYRDGPCVPLFPEEECKTMNSEAKTDQVITRYRNVTNQNVQKVLKHLEMF